MTKTSPLDVAPGRYWAWRHSPSPANDDIAARLDHAHPERIRLAILSTHPIQYHSPWFRALARQPEIDLHVYYCHRTMAHEQGVGFQVPFEWDIPLLDGYPHSFIRNVATSPSLDGFNGLNTPEIAEIIAARAADVALVNGWHYRSAWQAIRACWRHNVPIMARGDSHLRSPRSTFRRAAKALPFRAIIPRFSGCAPVGTWSREYFLHYGANPERVFVIPHTIDVERWRIEAEKLKSQREMLRERWRLDANLMTFLFAGKFVAKKNPLDFIRAVSRARADGASVQGLMVGDGPLRVECEGEVRATGASVRFAGFLNQSQIASAYTVCDALVLPSEDTWGIAVNEAMACGLPCIVSDRVGCGPDLINRQNTGEIVPLNSVERLAWTMAAWAGDPQRVRVMAASALRLTSSFAPDVAARATLEACRGVCAKTGRRATGARVRAASQ